MRLGSFGLWASIVVLCLSGCSERACTLVAAVPMVVVDTSALEIGDPDMVEVCLDEVCALVSESPLRERFSDLQETMIAVTGDESQRTLVVRAIDGEVLAGPQRVDIPTVYPNGEGCDGEALQGRYLVDAAGSFTLAGNE